MKSRPGDQHCDNAATTNPFIEQKPHVTEFTAQEIATLQSRLDKQLGPEYISTRPGAGGGKVHYLAAEKVINLANEVFGFNGWSSSIQNVQVDFVDENAQNGKITLGLSTIVRVTLRDGTFHEDIGYGHIENCKGKAAAFEKAKKEAATDAMKRALRNFGNVLGNCLYDKDYLGKVTKLKIAPTKWDADNLHRHPDYAPIKRESIADVEGRQEKDKGSTANRQPSLQSGASLDSMEFDDDFGNNPFDESDFAHPDEVRLDESASAAEASASKAATPAKSAQHQRQGVPRTHSMPQIRPPNVQPAAPVSNPQPLQKPSAPARPPNNAIQGQPARPPPPSQAIQHQQRPAPPAAVQPQNHSASPPAPVQTVATAANLNATSRQPQQQQNGFAHHQPPNAEASDHQAMPAPRLPPPGVPQGFVTFRNAELLNQPPGAEPPSAAVAFNPHAETPSIRRTQGVNPGKSAPVTRSAITGTPATNGQQAGPQPAAPIGPPQLPHNGMQTNGFNGQTAQVRTNYVNPSADMNRRVGLPPSAAAHTISNRGSFKPQTPMKRPPLADVSNIQQVDGPADAKKAKIEHPAEAAVEDQNVAAPPETTEGLDPGLTAK